MIKGVNRKVIEVSEMQCEYFEKIMFFVKPEYASISEGKIRDRASLIANTDLSTPPTKVSKSLIFESIKILGAVLIGGLIGGFVVSLF